MEPVAAGSVDGAGGPAMPVREGPPQPAPPHKGYSAKKARGAEIILRTPTQRVIFISGLIGAVVLAFVLVMLGFTRA
jgi:hypothetical protein